MKDQEKEMRLIKSMIKTQKRRKEFDQLISKRTLRILKQIEFHNLMLDEPLALDLLQQFLKYFRLRHKMIEKLSMESLLFYCYKALIILSDNQEEYSKMLELERIKNQPRQEFEDLFNQRDRRWFFDDFRDITISDRKLFNEIHGKALVILSADKRRDNGVSVYDQYVDLINHRRKRMLELLEKYPVRFHKFETEIPIMGEQYDLYTEAIVYKIVHSEVIKTNSRIKKMAEEHDIGVEKLREYYYE